MAVRRLFTPRLIVDILDAMPADGLVEFGEGALLVAVPSHRYEPICSMRSSPLRRHSQSTW
jgi:hypothetical protein